MQLIVIAAFAIVLAMPARGWPDVWVESLPATLALVAAQMLLPGLLAGAGAMLATWRLRRGGSDGAAHRLYGGFTAAARVGLIAGLVVTLVGSSWHEVVRYTLALGAVPLVDELVLLLPFFVGVLLCWLAAYPAERVLRLLPPSKSKGDEAGAPVPGTSDDSGVGGRVWPLAEYMMFNIRHHLLLMAVPMAVILLAKDVADRYRRELADWTGAPWAAEACLAATAGVMFVVAPVIMRRMWTTVRLADGPLRQTLENLCGRIGLRYREILLWRTGRMVVNAAVMGLLWPVRYVMLSDGLIEALAPREVEAVFGHEAGHVKHHHLFFYVLFAAAAAMVAFGGFELARRFWLLPISPSEQTLWALSVMLPIWLGGFGWVSRRFERQADWFAVTSLVSEVGDADTDLPVRQTMAAELYAATLYRIAVLNGIAPEARSWRHSSIASRMEFARRCARDEAGLRRFTRSLWWVKLVLFMVTLVGGVTGMVMYWPSAWRIGW
jgi:STE24 endopeptidase